MARGERRALCRPRACVAVCDTEYVQYKKSTKRKNSRNRVGPMAMQRRSAAVRMDGRWITGMAVPTLSRTLQQPFLTEHKYLYDLTIVKVGHIPTTIIKHSAQETDVYDEYVHVTLSSSSSGTKRESSLHK